MSDAEMIAAGSDLVSSYTIRNASGTQNPPRREQNCEENDILKDTLMKTQIKNKIYNIWLIHIALD